MTQEVEEGDILVHSTDPGNGLSMETANVTWTSNTQGTAHISGNIWMIHDIRRNNDWIISFNGTELSKGNVYSGDVYNRTTPFNFANGSGGPNALIQNVNIGDVIVLEVIQGKNSPSGDFVGVNLTITVYDSITN